MPASLTATDEAKNRGAAPVGGAPPVNLSKRLEEAERQAAAAGPQGPLGPIPQGAVAQPAAAPAGPQGAGVPQGMPDTDAPQGVSAAQALAAPEKPEARTAGEVRADFREYSDALKAQQARDEGEPPPADTGTTSGAAAGPSDLPEDDDGWDWDLVRDTLNNESRRKEIESRLEDMSIEDLILHGEVKQTVPVIPGVYEVTFRNMGTEEDLEVKRLMYPYTSGTTQMHASAMYMLMNLTCSVFAIGEQILPSHLDNRGNFVEESFWAKYQAVKRLPAIMTRDIYINYLWFDDRVAKLFLGRELGNG